MAFAHCARPALFRRVAWREVKLKKGYCQLLSIDDLSISCGRKLPLGPYLGRRETMPKPVPKQAIRVML